VGTTTIRLWPYQRGLYARDVLYLVWRMLEDAQAQDQLFWGVHDAPEIKGDLVACVRFFDDPGRHLVLVSTADHTDWVGCAWFDDLVPGYRCFGSIFVKPQYRGTHSREVLQQCCAYAFATLGIEQIWGVTPWPLARNLCLRSGFEEVAILPGFTKLNGELRDAYIVRKVRETHGEHV
jgi:RimJ/RimL family protein N-acetyltransferase